MQNGQQSIERWNTWPVCSLLPCSFSCAFRANRIGTLYSWCSDVTESSVAVTVAVAVVAAGAMVQAKENVNVNVNAHYKKRTLDKSGTKTRHAQTHVHVYTTITPFLHILPSCDKQFNIYACLARPVPCCGHSDSKDAFLLTTAQR